LPVVVEYKGQEAADAQVAISFGQGIQSERKLTLKPRSTTETRLPLPYKLFEQGDVRDLSLQLESTGVALQIESRRRLVVAKPAPAEAKIDGDLGEWLSRVPQTTPDQMSWQYTNSPVDPDPSDLSVTGWVGYDARGLWIAVRVKDDKIVSPQSHAVWNWDALQVGLDLATDSQPGGGFDDNDIEIELGASDDETWCYLGLWPIGWPHKALNDKLRGAVRIDREAGVVDYELLVPMEIIGSITQLETNSVLGFSIMVNDNDADGRAGWMELTPGIGLGKEPDKFAWLWLR
jgi:hypothetical protein